MIKFLVYVVIVLVAVAVAQLVRVFELSSELKGSSPHVVNERDNRMNSRLMLLFLIAFFAFFLGLFLKYKDDLLPVAASKHGVSIDHLFNVNMLMILIVFIGTQILLFYYAFRYYRRKDSKASYYPHNNRLELIWTVIPAIALTLIIIYGLKTWNNIMRPADKDAIVIGVYARQFQWTARYAGKDNKLGRANYKLIDDATNPLGLDSTDRNGWDDIVVQKEFHIPVNKEISFKFRSRDVIHSAFMPYFRAQMNCVPGMTTAFHFVPTITTAQMRKITHNPNFNYILLCNKVCGAGHYNMQMRIVVDTQADYEKWLATKKPFFAAVAARAEGNSTAKSIAIAAKTK